MKKLIKKYIKKDDVDILHNLRIYARKKLSKLSLEEKSDLGLVELLRNSSKLRDTDVGLKICKNKKAKKHLKKKHKKLRKQFIEFLKNFKSEIITKVLNENISDIKSCKNLLRETFINKTDKELHKIRLEVKKCRYTNAKYEKYLKKIQDNLGKSHDYYKCEKLMTQFGLDVEKIIKKKLKFVKKAEKAREEFLSYISTLDSSS